MRSRAVILPLSFWALMRASPAPCRASWEICLNLTKLAGAGWSDGLSNLGSSKSSIIAPSKSVFFIFYKITGLIFPTACVNIKPGTNSHVFISKAGQPIF